MTGAADDTVADKPSEQEPQTPWMLTPSEMLVLIRQAALGEEALTDADREFYAARQRAIKEARSRGAHDEHLKAL